MGPELRRQTPGSPAPRSSRFCGEGSLTVLASDSMPQDAQHLPCVALATAGGTGQAPH